ncbi:hypothetical protein PG987_003812 [Apiospora arundinis]
MLSPPPDNDVAVGPGWRANSGQANCTLAMLWPLNFVQTPDVFTPVKPCAEAPASSDAPRTTAREP